MRLFFPQDKVLSDLDELKGLVNFNEDELLAFDISIINFFDDLSKYLLKNNAINRIPELAAFAFWIRKPNIKKFISTLSFENGTIPVPRGIVFHIAPSNVDYMFLYSWFISILAGNKNILRISSNFDENIITTIRLLINFSKDRETDWFLNNNILLNYEHDEKVNELLSSTADCRIFWGGDETIKRMRKFDSKTTVKDIYFADKFSYTVVESAHYLNTSVKEKTNLANNFYKDSYLFNQKACSSPQVVFFSGGKKANEEASILFWSNLLDVLSDKQNIKSSSIVIEHYLNWFLLAANSKVSGYNIDLIKPTVVKVNKNDINSTYRTCGGGFFIESTIENLDELILFGSNSDQTLSYFGFSTEQLSDYARRKGSKSNLRIVPVGQSLNFNVFWDGYNLLYELIKIININ